MCCVFIAVFLSLCIVDVRNTFTHIHELYFTGIGATNACPCANETTLKGVSEVRPMPYPIEAWQGTNRVQISLNLPWKYLI